MIRSDNLSVMCYAESHIRPLVVGRVHFIPNSSDLPTTSFFPGDIGEFHHKA